MSKLVKIAKKTLLNNRRFTYTLPTNNKLYPAQWNWDSAFIALGYSHFNINFALDEISTLLKGQWKDGMIPHILFHDKNTKYFRREISGLGFEIKNGEHPIIPIMTYDALIAQKVASALLKEGIYVIGFFYPVVPKNEARIRVQISAGMSQSHLDQALYAFKKVGVKFNII